MVSYKLHVASHKFCKTNEKNEHFPTHEDVHEVWTKGQSAMPQACEYHNRHITIPDTSSDDKSRSKKELSMVLDTFAATWIIKIHLYQSQSWDQNMEPYLNIKVSLCTEGIFVQVWKCQKNLAYSYNHHHHHTVTTQEDMNIMITCSTTHMLIHYKNVTTQK